MKTLTLALLGIVATARGGAAEPRAVPNELLALGKSVTGVWKCKGEMHDGKALVAVTATNKVKLELDKWWIAETLEVKGGAAIKVLTYTTYDATAKKWRRVALDSTGGQMVGTADATATVFNLDMMGGGQFRDHTDPIDPKAGLHMWGEISKDKGKSWTKVYDLVCKK